MIQLLKYVSIVVGLEAEHVSTASALNFSSCLRSIIEKGQQQRPGNSGSSLDESQFMYMAADEQTLLAVDQCSSWVTLGFLRAIAASEVMCNLLSSSAWVNMLLRMVEAKGHVQNSDERGNVDLVSFQFKVQLTINMTLSTRLCMTFPNFNVNSYRLEIIGQFLQVFKLAHSDIQKKTKIM